MRVRTVVLGGSVLTVGLILVVFGVRGRQSSKPPLQIFPDMKLQPKYHAQGENRFFSDRRDMRTPPAGTVAFGGRNYSADSGKLEANPDFLQDDDAYYRGVLPLAENTARPFQTASLVGTLLASDGWTRVGGIRGTNALWEQKPGLWVVRIPSRLLADIPVEKQQRWQKLTPEVLDRGREMFGITCALCHGGVGNGKGITKLYGMAPANLHDDRIVGQPDGEIYNTLTNGKQSMKGYGHMIRPADRWAVVAYVRALQSSQRATAEDLKDLPLEERRKLVGANP